MELATFSLEQLKTLYNTALADARRATLDTKDYRAETETVWISDDPHGRARHPRALTRFAVDIVAEVAVLF